MNKQIDLLTRQRVEVTNKVRHPRSSTIATKRQDFVVPLDAEIGPLKLMNTYTYDSPTKVTHYTVEGSKLALSNH